MPLLDASLRHPLTLPDGTLYTNTVFLNQVIDHPNIEVGHYTYYNDFEPVADHAAFRGGVLEGQEYARRQ